MSKIIELKPYNVRTPLDEAGSLLNVDRIPGESLHSYADRLYGTYVRRSSSTYQGLLNGINRALGMEEKEVIKIDLRWILSGIIDGALVTSTPNSIKNDIEFLGIINGTSIVAVGNSLTDNSQAWQPDSLRGLTLEIGTFSKYEIISNTATEVRIRGTLSALVGQSYKVSLDLEENKLSGLALRLGEEVFKIDSNSSNEIFVTRNGLEQFAGAEYKVTAYNPRVEVTASTLYLYKEYANENNYQLESKINIRKDYKFCKEIVEAINESYYFIAWDLLGIKDRTLGLSLKRQSSSKIEKEIVPTAKFFKLANGGIKEGSVQFSESSVFLNEVEKGNVSQAKGNYSVEYRSGAVICNGSPSGTRTVSYEWTELPLRVVSSPAIVNSLADEAVKDFLFSQAEMKFYKNKKDQFIPGQPTGDMIEYIAELLNIKPQTWGE